MTKKWNDVKDEIERLYVMQGMPLEKVRQQVEKEHQFTASPRAYKEKVKVWGWQTYKKGCGQGSKGVKKSPCRSRVYRKAVASNCLQVGLRTLKEKLEWQTVLAAYESSELQSLQQDLGDQHLDIATREKLNQSMIRLESIEETIRELGKCLEGTERNEGQRNAPTGFAAIWKQDPMTLEDALGRIFLIPLDIVVSWEVFDGYLESFFQAGPGAKKVRKREYAIEDGRTRAKLARTQSWSLFSIPGRKIEMSMVFRDKTKSRGVCPGCNTISSDSEGELIQCKTPAYGMRFRTEEEEEQPVQQNSTRSSGSCSVNHITSTGMPTADTENKDEDTPGMFKRVIIKVAKQRHTQSMITLDADASATFDVPWDIYSLEFNDFRLGFQTWAGFDPPPADSNGIPFDWDQETFSTNYISNARSPQNKDSITHGMAGTPHNTRSPGNHPYTLLDSYKTPFSSPRPSTPVSARAQILSIPNSVEEFYGMELSHQQHGSPTTFLEKRKSLWNLTQIEVEEQRKHDEMDKEVVLGTESNTMLSCNTTWQFNILPPRNSRRRRRKFTAQSDNSLTVFTNGHHKHIHKHNNMAHKCGLPCGPQKEHTRFTAHHALKLKFVRLITILSAKASKRKYVVPKQVP